MLGLINALYNIHVALIMMQIQTMRKLPDTLHTHLLLQVALFQLPDVTLMVSVYNKRSMKRKEMIGWFSLGK